MTEEWDAAQVAEPPPHDLSIVVWDTPAPAVVGEVVRIKVGVHCSSGCVLRGQPVAILDGETILTRAILDHEHTSEHGVLHWAEVELAPADAPQVRRLVAASAGEGLETEHRSAAQAFSFAVEPRPDAVVDVTVTHAQTNEPCAAVEVRLGRYEAYTDGAGRARLHVPAGRYLATLRKMGLRAEPMAVAIEQDTRLDLVAHKGETREELEARLSEMENRPWA